MQKGEQLLQSGEAIREAIGKFNAIMLSKFEVVVEFDFIGFSSIFS
jgi:hypothetical protein